LRIALRWATLFQEVIMTGNIEEQELKDRLSLIENMIAEGRRGTERWGWTFVLWGVAYYVAIAWSTLGSATLAWPVTMIVAGVITGIVASRMTSSKPETTSGWAMGSIWIALGISMFLLFMAMGISHRFEEHVFVAVIGAMLGMANATSSMILKWKMQFACAVVWWAAAVAACFGSEQQSLVVFLVAIFFCQIVFGIYAMISESRRRRQQQKGSEGAVHA
jgi:fatty acid desaturase